MRARDGGTGASELQTSRNPDALSSAAPPQGDAAPNGGRSETGGGSAAGSQAASAYAESCGLSSGCSHEVELLSLLLPLSPAAAPLRAVLRAYYTATSQVAELAQAAREMLADSDSPLNDEAIAAALHLSSPFRHAPAEDARRAHAQAVAEVERYRRVEAELAPRETEAAAGGYGAEWEWLPLHGRCFRYNEGSIRYSICPFRHFKQDDRLVGNFVGWGSGDGVAGVAAQGAEPGQGAEAGREMRCAQPPPPHHSPTERRGSERLCWLAAKWRTVASKYGQRVLMDHCSCRRGRRWGREGKGGRHEAAMAKLAKLTSGTRCG